MQHSNIRKALSRIKITVGPGSYMESAFANPAISERCLAGPGLMATLSTGRTGCPAGMLIPVIRHSAPHWTGETGQGAGTERNSAEYCSHSSITVVNPSVIWL